MPVPGDTSAASASRRSNCCRSSVLSKAAGGDLAAKRSPRRPGTTRAPGLRAQSDAPFSVAQTGTRKEIPVKRAAGQVRLAVESCEGREVPAFLGPVTSAGGGIDLAVADVNQDGRSDLAVVRPDNTVSVPVSNGDGTCPQSDVLRGRKGHLYTLSFSDRNGDGWLDILAKGTGHLGSVTSGDYCGSYTGTVYTTVWLGQGDGT